MTAPARTTRRRALALVATAATSVSTLALVPPAYAATAAELAPAILKDPSVLVGSHLLDPSAGASTSATTQPLAGFPRDGESFGILSTGKASDAYRVNDSANLTTRFAGPSRGTGNDRDVTVLRLDLDVPEGVNCLTGVDFRFLSEEFPEYVGDAYNDAFIAELDSSTWTASGDTINAPRNFAFDPQGNVVSINASGAATMTAENATGTTFDGATDLLTAATPITPGPHALYLSIFDQGDDQYDSAVLVDNIRFGYVEDLATQCKPGATAAADLPAEPTHVTAGPIEHADVFGSADDTYTIPATDGVTYLVDGQEVAPGTYPGTGTVVVTAQPQDGYAIDGDTTFEVTFTAERATDLTSTGVGTAEQSVTVTLPTGGSVTLLDAEGVPTDDVTADEGGYVLDPATGDISFSPALGFSGTATGATFRITERDGTTSTARYLPTVTKPTGPVAEPLTSQGAAGDTQRVAVTGDVVNLLDGQGTSQTELVVPDEGTYRVEKADGWQLSFTPDTCFAGEATAADYEVVDTYEQSSASTYTPTVEAPAAPQPEALTSEGTGTEVQHTTASVPECGSLALVDDEGHQTFKVTRDGEGTYVLDAATGELTFTPVFGYSGKPAAVDVAVHDGFGNRVLGSYTVTVHAPAAPAPQPLTSTGVGTEPQSVTVTLAEGEALTLLDGDVETTELEVEGQGTYLVDPTTGAVSFLPARGFHGEAKPVLYQVTDAYGQRSTATFTATVELPDAPAPAGISSRGPQRSTQQVQIDVPAGGALALLDADGSVTKRIVVKGQGVYRLDTATATLTFTPRPGFHGKATPVTYTVTDSYGQVANASYGAVVARATSVRLTAPEQVRSSTVLPVVCRVTAGRVTRCEVTAYALVDGNRTVVGTGRGRADGTVSRVRVPVRLNAVGRALSAQPGGFRAELASVTRVASRGDYAADTTSHVVAPTVQLRPLYFATDSAALSRPDRRYLLQVRSRLGDVARVMCAGFTDARSTASYNRALGVARARSVCQVLTKGVRATVVTVGRGETRPVATNGTERGRALNRRVEVTLKY